jgi:deoxyribonuclease IV
MPSMPILGAHTSAAGGCDKAVALAKRSTCDCVQVFTKNNARWDAKPLTEEEISRFRAALAETGVSHPIAHASYLINMAAKDEVLRKKSIEAMRIELERANQLGLIGVVVHPGAYGVQSEEEGIAHMAAAIDELHKALPKSRAKLILESTAGQGTCMGHQFEQLAAMLSQAKTGDRAAICVDTCHLFAAGYPLADRKDYLATFRQFDKLIGLDRIVAFHLNDSKKPLGSRVDRHEHIGKGLIGIEAFSHLLNDKRFRDVPMYMEVPKIGDGIESDKENLALLRSLCK